MGPWLTGPWTSWPINVNSLTSALILEHCWATKDGLMELGAKLIFMEVSPSFLLVWRVRTLPFVACGKSNWERLDHISLYLLH